MDEDSKCCFHCKKEFSTKGNCKKHQKICKKQPVINKEGKINASDYSKLLNFIEEQKKEIKLLKKIVKNTNNTTNNTQNNITIFNTSQCLKDTISNLEPINFGDMKISFEKKFSNKYIDKGIEGLAHFICEVPCQNKFVTTDYSRKVITYKTPEQKIVIDPKANMLLNTTIKENADTIIDKAEDRYQYWKSQINDAMEEDIEPDVSDVQNKLHTKKLKSIAQKAKNNIQVESNDATNFIILKGMENKNTNAIE